MISIINKLLAILLCLFAFSSKADKLFKVYINVFKPIYLSDTAIFPNKTNFHLLEKKYKLKKLNITDATITVKDFESQKDIAVKYDESRKSYFFTITGDNIHISVKKSGYISQERIYLGNGHGDFIINPSDTAIRVAFYLFTKNEFPIVSGKDIYPYKPSKNKIVVRIFTRQTKNDYTTTQIDSSIKVICKTFNLTNLSNQYCRYPNKDIRDDFKNLKNKPDSVFFNTLIEDPTYRNDYYVILKKNTGNFNDSNCVELGEIRKFTWGKFSGILLGYNSLRETNNNLNVNFFSNIIESSILLEGIGFTKKEEDKKQYFLNRTSSIADVWKLYNFHSRNLSYQMELITTNY